MSDRRQKDVNWKVADEDGKTFSWDEAKVAVLMDLRDELKAIRRHIECPNVQAGFIAMRKTHSLLNARLPARRRKKK